MPLFLITFLSLYGSLNAYILIRSRSAFTPTPVVTAILSAWILLMTLAPLMVRMAEAAGWVRTAAVIAWPGYIWMGGAFLAGAALITADLIRVTVWILHRCSGMPFPEILNARHTCSAALTIALLASCYALYEARHVRTDFISLESDKLPPSIEKIRIVQISDVHVGILFRETRLQTVLEAVRAAQPDLFVSTGDLVDGRLSLDDTASGMDHLARMLASVPANIGKFAITGNHEYYAGLKHAIDFTQKAGFTVLRNTCVTLDQGITICGVDDAAGRTDPHQADISPEPNLLDSLSQRQFTVLLKHRPVISESKNHHFDLQLSGHVHKGQLFPFNLLVRLKFPIPAGTSSIRGTTIHVSRGSGTWGPPMRLFAPPEVTVIDLRRASAVKSPVL